MKLSTLTHRQGILETAEIASKIMISFWKVPGKKALINH